jgi:hypothetical protein
MKRILIVMLLCGAGWAQNGGVIPPPDIVGAARDISEAPARAQAQAAQTRLIQQQTALLKQQTDAMREQNALLKQQQAPPVAVQVPKQFIAAVRKPRIDDIDAATGKPRFATFGEYEDAKDEWMIEEAVRRFQALQPSPSGTK